MTEIYLDADEWSNILYALKKERDAQPKREKKYRAYLDGIISKIDLALSLDEEPSDAASMNQPSLSTSESTSHE